MIHLKIIDDKQFFFFGSAEKKEFTLGRRKTSDISTTVKAVAMDQFLFKRQPRYWSVENICEKSKSVVLLNNKELKFGETKKITSGDVIMVFENNNKENCLIIEVMKEIKAQSSSKDKKRTIQLTSKNEFYIGRDSSCDILLDNPQAEKLQARIIFDGEFHYIEDLKSTRGTYVNNKKIKRVMLKNGDRIEVPSAAYVYIDKKLLSSKCETGIEVDLVDVTKDVLDNGAKGKIIRLVDNVTMRIDMGSFVAIVGGSGAGKSTLLDCINGSRPCTSGKVYFDTNDFYQNMHCYQSVVGYVPQKDILHENLSVFHSLCYTATMRIGKKTPREEIESIVKKVIAEVKLEGKEHLRISSLSGGQKKRVSIAMELLSNPKIIFLDEPTSGLSPDLDLEIMTLLKELGKKGRTIVMITHAMENIGFCDKVAFLGRGGKLCFYDSPKEIKNYFKTKDFSKIFYMLTDEQTAVEYASKYRATPYYKSLVAEYGKIYQYIEIPRFSK